MCGAAYTHDKRIHNTVITLAVLYTLYPIDYSFTLLSTQYAVCSMQYAVCSVLTSYDPLPP